MAPPGRGNRQRARKVTLACEPCRERKARCDGGKPICSTCRRRSLALEQCVYSLVNAKTSCSDDYTKALHDRIRALERACELHGIDSSAAGGTDPPARPVGSQRGSQLGCTPKSPYSTASMVDSQRRKSLESPRSPSTNVGGGGVTAMGTIVSAEILDRSPDETHDFFGGSSTASFLKEACGTMSPRQPGLPASLSSCRLPSTAGPSSSLANVHKFALPPRHLAEHLIQRYFKRVYYLYPFFHRPAFEHAYRSLWRTDSDPAPPAEFHGVGLGSSPGADANSIVFHAAINALFALGCTFSDLPPSEKLVTADAFLDRAKDLIGIDMLNMNNLGVVQALLLAALVLQGTPFPDRCWNSVGVAGRVAQGLGLHTDGPEKPGESLERMIRRRTWHGCVIMDTFVSMTFGRPTMTTDLSIPRPGCSANTRNDIEQMKLAFYGESIYLSTVLEKILSKIYQPWLRRGAAGDEAPQGTSIDQNLETIMQLDTQLSEFEQSLPEFLTWREAYAPPNHVRAEDRETLAMQRNVLRARLLYIRLMLHRPVLMHLASTDLDSATNRRATNSTAVSRGLRSSLKLDCAKQCVRTAMELIDLVHGNFNTEVTGAWWWNGLYTCTSGLVLIVCRLCRALQGSITDGEVFTSWELCKTVLQSLATFSFSARKSLDLLLGIHEDVASKQNSHPSAQEPRTRPETVDRAPLDGSWDMSENIDFAFPLDVDTMGSFFNGWDTLDLMPSDQ